MRSGIRAICVLLLTATTVHVSPTAGTAATSADRSQMAPGFRTPGRSNVILWYDMVDENSEGWTHGDYTAQTAVEFHIDSYRAHPSGTRSYWCGRLGPDLAGGDGYGNSWDQRLLLPAIDLGMTVVEERSWGRIKADYRNTDARRLRSEQPESVTRDRSAPVLTFSYRHDCEIDLDATWLQAEVNGVWVDVLGPFTGSSEGWQESDPVPVSDYGDPLTLRFRFLSDGAWSDEDGLYNSDAGAFHVDNIRVYDYVSGENLFFDDGESFPGPCIPSVPAPAGDWWHIHEDYCSSAAYGYGYDPMVWWCGDESDSAHIPPGLQNWLQTPYVETQGEYWSSFTCTLRFALHEEVPVDEGDYWIEELTRDGGTTWYVTGTWWGDAGQCHGFSQRGLSGINIPDVFYSGAIVAARWTLFTNSDGCGPGAAGSAGLSLDHTWFEAEGQYRQP